jgi:hypothetical protein
MDAPPQLWSSIDGCSPAATSIGKLSLHMLLCKKKKQNLHIPSLDSTYESHGKKARFHKIILKT